MNGQKAIRGMKPDFLPAQSRKDTLSLWCKRRATAHFIPCRKFAIILTKWQEGEGLAENVAVASRADAESTREAFFGVLCHTFIGKRGRFAVSSASPGVPAP